ncbi:MAG: DUF169 domain-containing protein [Deltaproteobacteria bacterium]|nr:DUF169 domain-containing protein [Deltaproteobacteria bacterium]
MEAALKKGFLDRNEKYFPEADLPIAIFYSNDESYSEFLRPKKGFACMISRLGETFGGRTIAFGAGTIGCGGGLRYSGFSTEPDPDLKFFLSCGFEGKGRGLRLKATPELVEESETDLPLPAAEGKYLVIKRIDHVSEQEDPEVIAWLCPPDILSALVHLAAFRSFDRHCVICPQSSGCGSIIRYPLMERGRTEPRAVVGMFDISARPYVEANRLSLAVPFRLFRRMVEDMDESFLITPAWKRIKRRLR